MRRAAGKTGQYVGTSWREEGEGGGRRECLKEGEKLLHKYERSEVS